MKEVPTGFLGWLEWMWKIIKGIKIDLHLWSQETGKISLQFADVVKAVEKSELKMVMQRLGISLKTVILRSLSNIKI